MSVNRNIENKDARHIRGEAGKRSHSTLSNAVGIL